MRQFFTMSAGLAILLLATIGQSSPASAADKKYLLRTFETTKLEDRFLAEGATYGDVNNDKNADIIAGNFWYPGPDFKKSDRHVFYHQNKKFQKRPFPADVNSYGDNFFAYVDDINNDGWNDILIIQFPGEQTVWYENPKGDKVTGDWKSHVIFDVTDNESPTYTDLTGDGKKELVCQTNGSFGYAGPDPSDPTKPWKFHAISKQDKNLGKFTHGMGVGDVNGDGKMDVLYKDGWFQQPVSLDGDPEWKFHRHDFCGRKDRGGAQMYVYDVDGDGLNDVVTSLSAHEFGLSWFKQLSGKEGDNTFEEHKIMGKKAADNPYGVVFGELHAVDFIDMNGDGLKDIVTGKRWWSHGKRGDPDENSKPYTYWFELVRKNGEVEFVPHLISDDMGVGVQVVAGDFTGDGNPDVVVSNKKGTYIAIQKVKDVSKEEFEAAQPKKSEKAASKGFDPQVGELVLGHEAKPQLTIVPASRSNAQTLVKTTVNDDGIAKQADKLREGTTPEEAAKVMSVPPGFKVQLFAGEPDVMQPIAQCFDDRGRLWVCEDYTYPHRQPEGKGTDRILIFEDTNGDGKFDKRTVFMEKMNLLSGIATGFGGVYVGSAPHFLFIADANGDDVPDSEPKILLDGWGLHDTHETLNSFKWGPDGWLYGCHGVFTESNVGKPGAPNSERVHINAGIWRWHPTKHIFERFIEGTSNPWGVDFNSVGHCFETACVIPHLYHLQQGARYLRQGGQHDNIYTFDDIDTIAKHRHWLGDKGPHAGNGKSDAAGGGHAHAGAMFYLGGAWPEKYKDKLFMNNIHGSRLNMDIITRHGATGASYEGNKAPDFCYANDAWSQIINLQVGPDGQLTMIDWYDKQQCHRMDPRVHDRTNGRIFKIVYGNPEPLKPFDLQKKTDLELAQMALDKNIWYVEHSRRILQERAAKGKISDDAAKFLFERFHKETDVVNRLHCLWAMHVTAEPQFYAKITKELVNILSAEQNADVRAWIIQLIAEDKSVAPELIAKFAEMAKNDPAPIVRAYLASAMQRIPLKDCWDIAANLSQHSEDANDHNLPLLYWYSTEPLVMLDTERAMEIAKNCKIPKLARFIVRRAAAEEKGYEALISLVSNSTDADRTWMLAEIETILKTRANMKMPSSWKACYEKLVDSQDSSIREKAEFIAVKFGDSRVIPALRKIFANRSAQVRSRLAALDSLIAANDTGLPPILQEAIADQRVCLHSINALAGFDDANTPKVLIENYTKFTETEKQAAISTLTSRPAYILAMLDAMQAKKIPTTDLSAFSAAQIARTKNEAVLKRLVEVWGQIRESTANIEEETKKYKSLLTPAAISKADLPNGRVVFTKTCGTCHKLYGTGNNIGPELTGSNRAKLDYVLENVLDPSALVGKDYQQTTIVTKNGRSISGIIKNENDTAVTLQTPTDLVKIDKADIEERELSKQSLMPEGQLKTLKDNEIIDLIAYLQSTAQVALPGEGPQFDAANIKVNGAIEAEKLRLAGRVRGTFAPQNMSGFKEGKWSDKAHGWWTDGQVGDELHLNFPNSKAGRYEVFVAMTRAPDYATVKLRLNNGAAIGPFDLYSEKVTNTAPISLGVYDLKEGKQTLSIQIVGANPDAEQRFMFGLDYVFLAPRDDTKQASAR